MFLSQFFIAQGCGDPDPCGDSGHCCAVFELNHLEPAFFPHPCAETPKEKWSSCEMSLWCSVEQFVAAWRYDVVFRGGAWSVEKVFGLVGVQYWHAQMFRLTAFLGQMM